MYMWCWWLYYYSILYLRIKIFISWKFWVFKKEMIKTLYSVNWSRLLNITTARTMKYNFLCRLIQNNSIITMRNWVWTVSDRWCSEPHYCIVLCDKTSDASVSVHRRSCFDLYRVHYAYYLSTCRLFYKNNTRTSCALAHTIRCK